MTRFKTQHNGKTIQVFGTNSIYLPDYGSNAYLSNRSAQLRDCAQSFATMKKPERTEASPVQLFKPGEPFIKTAFVRIVIENHKATHEQAESIFESAEASGLLETPRTRGDVQIYRALPGSIFLK